MIDCLDGDRVDCVVIGGGPAGLAAAWLLRQQGHDVAVVERSDYDDFRPGEIVSPLAVSLLRSFGLADHVPEELRVSTYGSLSIWEQQRVDETSFMFGQHGTGWNVARPGFDRWLADVLAAQGVQVWRGAKILTMERAGAGHILSVSAGLRVFTVTTPVVLFASGRSPFNAAFTEETEEIDTRVALMAYVADRQRKIAADPRLLVEIDPEGWWYSAGLPLGKAVFGCLCEAASAPCRRDRRRYFYDRLQRTFATQQRLALSEAGEVAEVRVAPASSHLRRPVAGPGWARIGQSAMALDPLSGAGWTFSLRSASLATDAILDGMLDFEAYRDWVQRFTLEYRQSREQIFEMSHDQFETSFWGLAQ